MGRRSNRITLFPAWQSLAVAFGGGTLQALIDMVVPAGIVLYLAGITGVFVAASVFKYGHFRDEREFPKAVMGTVALCGVSSIWAGLCRHALCSLLCVFWELTLCQHCSIEFVKALVFLGGTLSILMGVLLSRTLGKQILTRGP